MVADRSRLSKTIPITVNRAGCKCTAAQRANHNRGSGVKKRRRRRSAAKGRRRRRRRRRRRKVSCAAACKNPNPSSVPCSAQCKPPSKGFLVSMKPQTGDKHECDVFVFRAAKIRATKIRAERRDLGEAAAGAKMKFQCQRTTEIPKIYSVSARCPKPLVATFPAVFAVKMFYQIFKPIITKAIEDIGKKIKEAFTGGNKDKAKQRKLQSQRRGKQGALTAANSKGNGMKQKLELEEREFEVAYEAHLADELNDTW